jgi:hypothetical protein
MMHTCRIFVAILIFQEQATKALTILDFIRDLAEEKFCYEILMDTYLVIGRILQEEKNYSRAVVAYKLLLIIAW